MSTPLNGQPLHSGSLEVIVGCMFSGKSGELIRRLRQAQAERLAVAVFKPALDTRYATDALVTHAAVRIDAAAADTSEAILSLLPAAATVVGIDEAQFFDDKLPDVLDTLANRGLRVIAAGLNMDFLGRPFGPVPQLLARADAVTVLRGVCATCGRPAGYSFRTASDVSAILLGDEAAYEPRCRVCFGAGRLPL